MGRKTSTETLARIFVAFLQRSTWSQKDLERHCDVSTRTIRRCLLDLQSAGLPFEREVDSPNVYWSIPKRWLPSHALIENGPDIKLIARLIARLPRSEARERVLENVVDALFSDLANQAEADVADEVLRVLEEAATRRVPVRISYYSASRGEHGSRTLSVHRIVYGDRTRIIASCHISSQLKWFRADRITSAKPDEKDTFKAATADEIDRFFLESLDGFRGSEPVETCELFVRAPESRWLVRNLPPGAGSFVVSHQANGARLLGQTAAIDILARFVVGYGGAIRVEHSPALRARVRAIARAALLAHDDKLNTSPGSPISPRRNRARLSRTMEKDDKRYSDG